MAKGHELLQQLPHYYTYRVGHSLLIIILVLLAPLLITIILSLLLYSSELLKSGEEPARGWGYGLTASQSKRLNSS